MGGQCAKQHLTQFPKSSPRLRACSWLAWEPSRKSIIISEIVYRRGEGRNSIKSQFYFLCDSKTKFDKSYMSNSHSLKNEDTRKGTSLEEF